MSLSEILYCSAFIINDPYYQVRHCNTCMYVQWSRGKTQILYFWGLINCQIHLSLKQYRDCLTRSIWLFVTCIKSVLGLNRGCGQFLNFLGAPMTLISKSVFLAVNGSLSWLNNVTGVYLFQVFSLLIGQQGLGHFFRSRPFVSIGWRIVQILRQCWRKTTNKAPTTLSALQAAYAQLYSTCD